MQVKPNKSPFFHEKGVNEQPFWINVVWIIIAVLFLVFYITFSEAEAADWYVDDSVSSSGDGTSWATAFMTITEGINAASAGDTVHVEAGTYQERLVIDKQLTLTGADWDSTIVQSTDTPSAGVYDVEIDASGTVIENFQFDFNGSGETRSGNGIVVSDLNDPPVTNVQIRNNKIYTGDGNTGIQTGKYSDVSGLVVSGNIFYGDHDGMGEGIYINPYSGSGEVTIQGNEFYGYLYSGVSIEASNVDVVGNTINSDIIKGVYGIRFIELTGGMIFNNVLISNNDIGNVQYGISVGTSTDVGSTLTATIDLNTLTVNDIGIRVRYGADLTITNNNISGNTQYGINNETTTLVVAENNWWGDASGPFHSGTNPTGLGNAVSDNVDYDPWVVSTQADFTASPTAGDRPLAVSFTDTSTGPIDTWSWDFNNDSVIESTERNPTYIYTETGTYTVTLTVSGPAGSDAQTITDYIVVTNPPPPIADFSGTPLSGGAPLNVSFTDSSTGNITSWSWNFGDGGTSTEQNPSHTYTSAGIYTVSLIVTGLGGSDFMTKSNYITVYMPPVADFTAYPTSGYKPLSVQFNNTSSGDIYPYPNGFLWDFGDGGTSTLPSPGHTYSTAGTYTVTLTAMGPGGTDTKIREGYIIVNEILPIADFSANLTSGIKPLTVQFTDKSLNDITSWSWTFGDGGISTEQNPIHTYTIPGAFTVTLTVTGPNGSDTKVKVDYIYVTDIIIDRSPGNVTYPQVAADGNGHVYAVWEDTRNGSSDIYFNYSSDYGFTWQTADIRLDTDVPGTSHSNSPQIACDNNGYVYVVWVDERNGSPDVYFNYSSDYGTSWQSPDKKLGWIPYNPNPQFPMVACDNNGHVYVAWNDNYFNTSNNYGATWLAQATRISTIGGEETQLGCDQNGHVYVAWRLGTTDVLFNSSSDYGATWQSTDSVISNTGAKPYGSISLDTDENGHVYVVWHDGRTTADSPDIYLNSSSDYGITWRASDIKINSGTPGTTYSIWPEITCDQTGHVYVIWYDRRNSPPEEYNGDIYLNYSSDYGDSWQGLDMRLDTDSPGTIDSGYPEIVSDNGGHICVIWSDNQAGIGPGLYMNYSLDYGTTWLSANEKVGSSGFHPQMSTDGSRFYMIWDYYDIFFNEVAFTEVPPFIPANPFPLNGATQVGLSPVLSWRFGDANLNDTLTYDIYFGTSPTPPLVSSNQAETIYALSALSTFTTYYWQVVARDSQGQTTAGPVWSFTTISGPPYFTDFSPGDGETGVPILGAILSWTAIDPDGDPLTYDVYFGKTNPPALMISNYSSNTFNPGMLSRITVYYWKVVARDDHGTSTVGPVLSFTTINELPQFNDYAFAPRDQATGVDLAPRLEWSAYDPDPGDTITYDVYFGTSSPPPPVSFNRTTTNFSPGQLTHYTVYYWKIVARDNHGAETESSILAFRTLNHPPQFIDYYPPGYETGVSITPTILWNAIDLDPGDVITYDIYFGTSPSPPLVISNQLNKSYSPGLLLPLTRYYWKVVAHDHHGAVTALPVLFFDTSSSPPQFDSFSPEDGTTGVNPLITLSWSAFDPDSGDTITFDVYLGKTFPLTLKSVNQATMTYKPTVPLTGEQLYYWKIVARDNHGVETESPILSFTTGTPLVGCSLLPNFTTIRRGETLSLQATVTNNTGQDGTVLFVTRVTLPNGNKYPPSSYLVGPISAYLSPHGSKSLDLSHTIPLTAPLGIYTYHGYVGRRDMGLFHECQFDFEVTL